MSRKYQFMVTMEVADDDQTDPQDMEQIILEVLSGDRRMDVADLVPEAVPKWKVRVHPKVTWW